MSIKEDKWIREMALTQEMIEPFVDRLINVDENTNKKLISYGL